MKKKQKKTKVEVVEPVSVANKCDYQRSNGKCGRAMCGNFGKPCTGRACEDWKCDAEGDEVEKAGGGGEETPCINFGGEDYCKEYRDDKITCDNCPKWRAERKSWHTGSAVAVVEPKGGAVGMTEQDIAAGISRQCTIIEEAEKNAEHERIKLGIVLIRWEQYLGESRGRGKSGNGLKGWLEANVPKLKYNTALCYKQQAERAITMSGGGAHAQAALMGEPTVTQPNGDVIDVDATYVKKATEVLESADSRRKLEQQYFEFMAKQGKKRQGGANKGQSGTGRRALTAEEKSDSADVEIRELVGKIGAFDKSGKFRMLTVQTQSDIVLYLKDVVKSFEEQQS